MPLCMYKLSLIIGYIQYFGAGGGGGGGGIALKKKKQHA